MEFQKKFVLTICTKNPIITRLLVSNEYANSDGVRTMISEYDKNVILEYVEKFDLSSVILFGSSLYKEDANDIDIGVKGIRPEVFFKFYGQLMLHLSINVDVVDLSKRNAFTDLVEREGMVIYG
jgi:predicted nucleotidyltransferase